MGRNRRLPEPQAVAYGTMVAITAMLTLLANREASRRWGSSSAYIAPILLTAGSVDQVLPGPNLWIVTRGKLVLAGGQAKKSPSA